MAAIQTLARFYDLTTGGSPALLATAVGGAAGDLVDVQITKTMDKPWHVHFGLLAFGTACAVVSTSTGGSTGTQIGNALLCELSLDNGATVDVRLVITSAQRLLDPQRPMLVIDQDDMSVLYGVTGVDRLTMIHQTPDKVFNAKAGDRVLLPRGHIGNGGQQQYVKGLYQVTVGDYRWSTTPVVGALARLTLTAVIDPTANKALISLDANSDTIQRATITSVTRLAGVVIPNDTAPVGSRGHFVFFTGDAARNHVNTKQCVSIGRVDTMVRTTFYLDATPPGDYHTYSHCASTGMTIDPRLADLYVQASFQGGRSDHGLPTNPKITCCEVTGIDPAVFPPEGTSTRWDASLPVIGTDTGVYYYPGYEFFVPMSQRIPVDALAYDPQNNMLYAATPYGVISHSGTPANPYPSGVPLNKLGSPDSTVTWPRLGGLSAPVEDVWVQGAIVYARCGGTTKKNGAGVDGVYRYPALPGDTSGVKGGYKGWSRIAHSGSPLAAGGIDNAIYYTDKNKPNLVYLLQPGSSAKPQKITLTVGLAKTPANVVSIDSGAGYVYIITDQGSNGLFVIQNLYTIPIDLNKDGTLKDPDTGGKVHVYHVKEYLASIDGLTVWLFAFTDSGIFYSDRAEGGNWKQPNFDSGLTQFVAKTGAVGRTRTVLTHKMTSLYAVNDTSFLLSDTGGDYWTDVLTNRVSLVSFWVALAQQCGAVPWPDRTIANLGTLGGNSDPGPPGTKTIPIPSNNPRYRGPGVIWSLRLDEHNDFTAREFNLNSKAPLAGIQWHELPELQAGADVGVITAAEQVAVVTDKWLGEASTLQTQYTVQGAFTQDDDPLRDLAPTDAAAITFNPPDFATLCAMTNQQVLVLEHAITQDGALFRTKTTMGTSLSMAPADVNTLSADIADRLQKRLRWGSS